MTLPLRCASLVLPLSAACLLATGGLAAQSTAGTTGSPRVEAVTIRGVSGVPVGDLRNGLATQPTHCRSLLLKPFCLVSSAGAFVEKHNLDRSQLPQDELRIRVYLWRRGWRQSTVTTAVTPRGQGVAVTFNVNQGPATIVRSLTLEQPPKLLGARQIHNAVLPDSGEPLDVLALDSARTKLLVDLWNQGYGDAVVRDTAVPVDSLGMAVRITLEPGRHTTIGQIAIEGNQRVSDRTILDALPIRKGQLYRHSTVAEAQRALYLTGMFRQSLVSVAPGEDTAKTVQVSVTEAPFRQLRTSVGLTTVDYVQTEAQFTQFNWLGGGRRLDISGLLGRLLASQMNGSFIFRKIESSALSGTAHDAFLRPTWQASAQITQPAFPASGNSIGIGVFTHRRVEPAVVVDKGYGGNITFTHNLADRVPLSLTYRYERNSVLAGDVYFCVDYGVCDAPTIQALQGQQSLSPLTISGFLERVDDALTRTSGYMARLSVEHASQITASDFRYNRAEAELERDLPLGNGTLAARVHGGWVRALSGTASAVGVSVPGSESILHPTTRFYAGGSRSVRGYAENQLGPRILTVDPDKLLTSTDSAKGGPCTEATIANGTCDPNIVQSSSFTARPTGGTRLVEASVEFRHPIWGNLVGAVFVDGARVGDPNIQSLASARTAITPGFGVRYRSPIGPVRVDLGIKPTTKENLTVITQVTENGVNRLVRLATQKQYDPMEGNNGFLRRVAGRLTLHLSIGEAF